MIKALLGEHDIDCSIGYPTQVPYEGEELSGQTMVTQESEGGKMNPWVGTHGLDPRGIW